MNATTPKVQNLASFEVDPYSSKVDRFAILPKRYQIGDHLKAYPPLEGEKIKPRMPC